MRRRPFLALAAALALSACVGAPPVVSPEVAARLDIRSVDVAFAPGVREEFSLNGVSYGGNFRARLLEAVRRQGGGGGDRPARLAVQVDAANLAFSRGSSASGTFRVIDARTGATISGPDPFTASTQGAASQGGLIGAFATGLVAGVARNSPRAVLAQVEGLGTSAGTSVRRRVLGR